MTWLDQRPATASCLPSVNVMAARQGCTRERDCSNWKTVDGRLLKESLLASSGRVRGRLYVQWRAALAGRIDITDNILIAASPPSLPSLPDTATPGQLTALLVSRAQKSLFSSAPKIHCVPFLCPLLLSYSVLKERGRRAIGGGGAGPSILSTEKGKCNSIIHYHTTQGTPELLYAHMIGF